MYVSMCFSLNTLTVMSHNMPVFGYFEHIKLFKHDKKALLHTT